jgi:hypothetical protein
MLVGLRSVAARPDSSGEDGSLSHLGCNPRGQVKTGASIPYQDREIRAWGPPGHGCCHSWSGTASESNPQASASGPSRPRSRRSGSGRTARWSWGSAVRPSRADLPGPPRANPAHHQPCQQDQGDHALRDTGLPVLIAVDQHPEVHSAAAANAAASTSRKARIRCGRVLPLILVRCCTTIDPGSRWSGRMSPRPAPLRPRRAESTAPIGTQAPPCSWLTVASKPGRLTAGISSNHPTGAKRRPSG